ncbi:hypothetical protein O6H91_08G080300 [Diphasiastrum complanatum]|uniref:Uncharacterized protein n=1 Tax=Diphasiastrum complanatum TaxID=34168 RepID=A0ACC2CZ90_DIPCM|nr:hypothetical protein O6H91_08G080300 [Diphasiastrum complanatum]
MKTSKDDVSENSCIVWPPVVIIENTRQLKKSPKCSALKNKEVGSNFSGLKCKEIRAFLKRVCSVEYSSVIPLYDIRGPKGKTLVTFPGNDLGYANARTLSDCFQRMGRGREQWMKVMPKDFSTFEGWNTKNLVAKYGSRILYGYIARPKDMEQLDPHKKTLKNWSAGNPEEKVHRPVRQRNQVILHLLH